MLDFETLCEANRLGNSIPSDIETLSSYEVDWAVSDKEELHSQLRPWIFREIMEFVRLEEAGNPVVDSIMSGIKPMLMQKMFWSSSSLVWVKNLQFLC